MNWVDLVILAVILLSALIGFMRGFVREVLGIGAWVLAAFVAVTWFHPAQQLARRYIDNPDIADPVAFVVLFLLVLIVLSIVAGWIGRLARASPLGGVDRSLGVLFGLVRGFVLFIAIYIGCGMLLPADHWPPPVQRARSLSYIYAGAAWAANQLPAQYRPHVVPPPAGRQATAAELLQASPSGKAMAPPAARN